MSAARNRATAAGSDQRTTQRHRRISQRLHQLGIAHTLEKRLPDCSAVVDIALQLPGIVQPVALEVDGPSHACRHRPYLPNNHTLARNRILRRAGYAVVSLPWFRFSFEGVHNAREREYVRWVLETSLGMPVGNEEGRDGEGLSTSGGE